MYQKILTSYGLLEASSSMVSEDEIDLFVEPNEKLIEKLKELRKMDMADLTNKNDCYLFYINIYPQKNHVELEGVIYHAMHDDFSKYLLPLSEDDISNIFAFFLNNY